MNDRDEDILSRVTVMGPKKPQLPSEADLAVEFALRHQDELRYCGQLKGWLSATGSRWLSDQKKYARRLALRFVQDKAEQYEEPKLASEHVARAILFFAEAHALLATASTEWDTGYDELCTPAGVIDLPTGRVRPWRPADYHTLQTAVAPRPGCPRFLKALDEIFLGKQELVEFLQTFGGYCLTGQWREQCFVFAHGGGRNGKDTVFELLRRVMGSYADILATETLLASKFDRHTAEVAVLRGLRLAVAGETPKNWSWNESRIKQLTGGSWIQARFMRGNPFSFAPTAKLVIHGNEQPKLASISVAFRERIKFLPFRAQFTGKDEVKGLKEQLFEEEGPGILDWYLEGAVRWYAEGLNPPAEVTAATDEYMAKQDVHGRWIEECLDLSNRSKTTSLATLFTNWKTWAEDEREFVGSANALSRELVRRWGMERKRHGEHGIFFTGVSEAAPK